MPHYNLGEVIVAATIDGDTVPALIHVAADGTTIDTHVPDVASLGFGNGRFINLLYLRDTIYALTMFVDHDRILAIDPETDAVTVFCELPGDGFAHGSMIRDHFGKLMVLPYAIFYPGNYPLTIINQVGAVSEVKSLNLAENHFFIEDCLTFSLDWETLYVVKRPSTSMPQPASVLPYTWPGLSRGSSVFDAPADIAVPFTSFEGYGFLTIGLTTDTVLVTYSHTHDFFDPPPPSHQDEGFYEVTYGGSELHNIDLGNENQVRHLVVDPDENIVWMTAQSRNLIRYTRDTTTLEFFPQPVDALMGITFVPIDQPEPEPTGGPRLRVSVSSIN